MRLTLSALLLAAAVPCSAQGGRLQYASDGTPMLVLPLTDGRPSHFTLGAPELEAFCAQPGMAAFCVAVLKALPQFYHEVQPVTPRPVELAPASRELLQLNLPERLDTTARIPDLYWPFNKRNFFSSTAFDRDGKVYFAFFTGKRGEEVLEPEGGRLLKSSIPVDLDAETHYVITLQINIFDPEKSYLLYTPARNFGGKQNKVRADKAMQYIHNAGVTVPFSKGDLQFFYATDADPKTKKLADSRTLSFVKEDGRNTKYYTVRDEQLPKEQWVAVDLGDQPALLFRTAADTLLIHEPS